MQEKAQKLQPFRSQAVAHGNTGNTPVNRTKQSIRDELIGVADLFTRTDPATNKLHCINDNYQGVAGLISETMHAEAHRAFATKSRC